ncbi:LppX_LprAFG lipoprotein [Streptomyces sp. NPDC050610]|uniref:LppX_LprAFG lipoprotein n=1 Tax=Streptomyces sp. NPDC050610 TaxID=3157097 RepID=UPI0034150C21
MKASASAAAKVVDEGAAVRAAVAATTKTTARVDGTVQTGGGGMTFTVALHGAFDWPGAKGRLRAGLYQGTASDKGKEGPHLDEIFADDTVYLGGFPEQHGTWGSIRRGEAEAHYPLRAPMNDPDHVLRQIARMRHTSKVGQETVGGAPATHYRGVLDADAVKLRMAQTARAKLSQIQEMLGELSVPADVWVDGSGRVVRTRLTLDMAGAGSTATMNLSGFGKPVEAHAPDPGKVTPMPQAGGPLPG